MTGPPPTVAVVDLDAIRHNVRFLKPPDAELMAVVKAGAYGHGEVPVARAALEAGATWLGVAQVPEGLRLREAGVDAPILVLSEFAPGSEKEAVAAGLTPSLYTDHGLEALAAAAESVGSGVGVHVKVDTGMHRVGLPPERAVAFAGAVRDRGLTLEGVWTHFATADEPGDGFWRVQLERYESALKDLADAGHEARYRHAANSAAILLDPSTHFDLVRPGIAMYGWPPGAGLLEAGTLRPALEWRTHVTMVKRVPAGDALSYGQRYRLERESTIATLPVGYADGYSRRMSGLAEVAIRGGRFPVAGTVTMDQILVDCGDEPVEPGDEAVLLGRQGDVAVTAEELATWSGTISYEVLCAIGARVARQYEGTT